MTLNVLQYSQLYFQTEQLINLVTLNFIPLIFIFDRSESGSTFEMWACNWTTSMLKSIKDATISNVLNACRPAFKRNMKIITFCIPYIVGEITIEYIRKFLFR